MVSSPSVGSNHSNDPSRRKRYSAAFRRHLNRNSVIQNIQQNIRPEYSLPDFMTSAITDAQAWKPKGKLGGWFKKAAKAIGLGRKGPSHQPSSGV
ncbi:MAG: hypothetical protein Q9165_004424, partial [Trypethelium subeluteriae]